MLKYERFFLISLITFLSINLLSQENIRLDKHFLYVDSINTCNTRELLLFNNNNFVYFESTRAKNGHCVKYSTGRFLIIQNQLFIQSFENVLSKDQIKNHLDQFKGRISGRCSAPAEPSEFYKFPVTKFILNNNTIESEQKHRYVCYGESGILTRSHQKP